MQLLLCCGVMIFSNSAPAQPSSSASGVVTVEGRVVDAQGNPIEAAAVRLMFPRYQTREFESGGSISTASDTEGRFQLNLARSDPRLLRTYLNVPTLMVTAPGFAMQLQTVPVYRLLVDVPLEVPLQPSQPTSLLVTDSRGEPVPDAGVRPAIIGALAVPYAEVADLESISDARGRVLMEGLPAGGLTKVYVSSPNLGHQCLSVGARDDELWVETLETREVHGQVTVTPPTGHAPVSLNAVELCLYAEHDKRAKQYSWSKVRLHSDGTFDRSHLCNGTISISGILPPEMPYAFDRMACDALTLSPGAPLELTLLPATRVEGKVTDAESAAGIPNIFVAHFDPDGRDTISDADGNFWFWAGPHRISFHPFDALGRYVDEEAFYRTAQSLPEDGVVATQPVHMRTMSTAVGQVVQRDGAPVAGAIVECSFRMERFTVTRELYSDTSGQFQFYGVPEGTAVVLKARTDRQAAEPSMSLVLSPDARPQLVMADARSARFVGQVVDSHGIPVKGALVRVRYAKVVQEETGVGEDRVAEPLLDESVLVVSDIAGKFETPPTSRWDQDVSVTVTAPGFQTLNSPWRHWQPSNFGRDGTIDVGTLRLLTLPRTVIQHVAVHASSGEPLSGARVVFLGAKSGMAKARTGQDGTIELPVADGVQLVAAHARGFLPEIRAVDSLSGTFEFKLQPLDSSPPARQPAVFATGFLRQRAQQLMQLVPEPRPNTTPFKVAAFQMCLGFADPQEFVDRLTSLREAGEDTSRMLAYVARMPHLSDKQVRQLEPYLPDGTKVYLWVERAAMTESPEETEELLSEALIAARSLSGDEQLYAYSSVVHGLLRADHQSVAEDLVEEVWSDHHELRDMLQKDERLTHAGVKRGVARTYAPLLALVDAERAMKLIAVTADADEIDYLKSRAVAFMAGADAEGWRVALQTLGTNSRVAAGIHSYCSNVGVRDARVGRALADALPTSFAKVQILLHVAENAAGLHDEQRAALARKALTELRDALPDTATGHPSEIAASACRTVRQWHPQLAEEFAFESLWLCEGETRITPFNLTSELAIQLAGYDRRLARALVVPCFDDWSWLFGDRDFNVMYKSNDPLRAAATIDPDWAVAKARELLHAQLDGHPSRQLATAWGIISRWQEMSADKGR